jgi:hypothetical protein
VPSSLNHVCQKKQFEMCMANHSLTHLKICCGKMNVDQNPSPNSLEVADEKTITSTFIGLMYER